jgi:hypothetical protein
MNRCTPLVSTSILALATFWELMCMKLTVCSGSWMMANSCPIEKYPIPGGIPVVPISFHTH